MKNTKVAIWQKLSNASINNAFNALTETFGEVGKGWGWDVMSETVIDQNGADAICVSVRGWFQHGGQMYSISETFGSFKRVSEVGFKQARQQAIKNAVVESFTFLGLAANERLA